jgi:hypothetical protein
MQRKLNSTYENIARSGAAKKLTDPAIKEGMTRQTSGEPHPSLHSQPIDDEVPQKSYVGKEVPLNPGTHPSLTKSTQRGNRIDGEGSAQLQSAARLGRSKA